MSKEKLANISAILMDLSSSYYDVTKGCWGFRQGEYDIMVQECLATYEREILRQELSVDVPEWMGLISRRIEGRCSLKYRQCPGELMNPKPSAYNYYG